MFEGKTATSNSLPDETNDEEERADEEFQELLKNAKEEKNKKTDKEKKAKVSFQQQLLELQQNQLKSFQDSEVRMQEMMLQVFEEQRKADMAEREKDREFMLQLGKIFAQKKD